jgi:hypothetical protein
VRQGAGNRRARPDRANASAAVPVSSTFTWNGGLGATAYDVYFGTTSAPALVATVIGTSYKLAALAESVTCF